MTIYIAAGLQSPEVVHSNFFQIRSGIHSGTIYIKFDKAIKFIFFLFVFIHTCIFQRLCYKAPSSINIPLFRMDAYFQVLSLAWSRYTVIYSCNLARTYVDMETCRVKKKLSFFFKLSWIMDGLFVYQSYSLSQCFVLRPIFFPSFKIVAFLMMYTHQIRTNSVTVTP